jgi:hypothetical protein
MPYKNKLDERARTASRNRKARVEGSRIVKEAKSKPCADCGGTFHFSAMDFDHVRGKKRFEIAPLKAIGTSVKRLLAEIEKCDVVCSNCHRVRTYKQRFIDNGDGTFTFNPNWLRKRRAELRRFCPQGHAYKGKNLGMSNGVRYCRTCKREQARRKRDKQKKERNFWLERYSNGTKRKNAFKVASDGRLVIRRMTYGNCTEA